MNRIKIDLIEFLFLQHKKKIRELYISILYLIYPSRQVQWLEAVGRVDLLEKDLKKLTHRVCSRHFSPLSIKNKHLCADAVPTLCLPSDSNEGKMNS